MPRFSVVVPTYNGERYVGECLESVLSQRANEFDSDFPDVEVIVVDDCSTDATRDVVSRLAHKDGRLRLVCHEHNGGTLRSRRDGVLAASGEYVLLIDQDDALVPHALAAINRALDAAGDPDILHFGVHVIAANEQAEQAACGMGGFLTPSPRRLGGEGILVKQFAERDGFDWHVHHRAIKGDLARKAWRYAGDESLTLSDDLYASFILCSLASTYVAVGDSPWYEYHLGRGETFGARTALSDIEKISYRDRRGLALVERFARSGIVSRPDWADRVADVRDRLIEHVMNELHDGLAAEEQRAGIDAVLSEWPAYAVAGELYRFARDRAYALFDARTYPSADDELHRLVGDARYADRLVENGGSDRYEAMRAAALRHLDDLEHMREQQNGPADAASGVDGAPDQLSSVEKRGLFARIASRLRRR